MDVYLVPVGDERYELYCEVPEEPEAPPNPDTPAGWIARIRRRFSELLAEAERERHRGASLPHDAGWIAHAKARTMRWVAESIAEQRLLWHLRRQTEASLFYPDDLTEPDATARLRTQLGRDRDRHRLWLAIDSVAFVLSGLLVLLPGPNVLAYYFGFRLVGHYLSMMGARRGLEAVRWRNEQSAPLSELRRAIGLDDEQRAIRVTDVALRLRLEHLAKFFERTVAAS
jgi:Mitochondrial K+-H+ exchange-related